MGFQGLANSNFKEVRWMVRIKSLANSQVEGKEME
jgi:hypothetical protein